MRGYIAARGRQHYYTLPLTSSFSIRSGKHLNNNKIFMFMYIQLCHVAAISISKLKKRRNHSVTAVQEVGARTVGERCSGGGGLRWINDYCIRNLY